MTAKSLRALAKDHANGVLDKESYRKARDAYLNSVISGEIPIAVNEYRPLVQIQDLDTTFEKTAVNAVPPKKETSPPPSSPIPASPPRPTKEFVPPGDLPFEPVTEDKPSRLPTGLLIGAIAFSLILLAILAGLMILRPDTGVAEGSGEVADVTTDDAGTAAANTDELIAEFLKLNDWSDFSLQQFSEKWTALDPSVQNQALATPQMTRLSNAIYQQLVEVRSVSSQGGDPEQAVVKQRRLVDFAALLGISDPRLVVRETAPVIPVTPVETAE